MISGASTLVKTPRRCYNKAIERASLLTSADVPVSLVSGLSFGIGEAGCCSIDENQGAALITGQDGIRKLPVFAQST